MKEKFIRRENARRDLIGNIKSVLFIINLETFRKRKLLSVLAGSTLNENPGKERATTNQLGTEFLSPHLQLSH